MKKIVFILSLILLSANVWSQNLVLQADSAYVDGRFSDAVALYEQAIDEQGTSAQLYYNIGNSYYRLNKVAPAILNYERALLLDPANEDIKFNLEIAKLKTVDRIETPNRFFLIEGYTNMQNLFSTDTWSYIAIAGFILLIGCLVLFFFSRKAGIKKLGFYIGLLMLIVCILANIHAYRQQKELQAKNTAIIFSPTTTIKSSPDASGTDLFILHEGTKVKIKDKVGDWSEIETQDGNVGWIRSSEIEVI
ncbi:tetratricopeptide repeat protein [Bacteroidales bacterium OttesenSCG-928-L03]|nr:tetratricopeptide repeat protein [Bacteroidales bacterium OttesenSCG-928-L03]